METQQQQRKRRSSSRSPSLSRRSSLRDASKSATSAITKSKSKRGLSLLSSGGSAGASPGSASAGPHTHTSKKERWLLTRKTWRYMTDAVGNLLPEYYSTPTATTTTTQHGKGSFSAATQQLHQRRGSSAGSASSGVGSSVGGGGPLVGPITSPPPSSSSGYTSYSLASPPYRQSVPRSSICSSSGTVPLVTEEEEDNGGGKSSAAHGALPGKIDVPAMERHFDQACAKEKKFLLWTRNKAKGLSGPALRDAKLKAKQQQQEEKGAKSGKKEESQSQLPRSQSSSSMGGFMGSRSGRRATQDLLDYFSPGEEECSGAGGALMHSGTAGLDYDDDLLLMDDGEFGEYDEYADIDEQIPPQAAPVAGALRRKSSTASSIVSMVSGGLSFFRSKVPGSGTAAGAGSTGGAPPSQPPQQPCSATLGRVFIRTIPSTGVQKFYRNSGVQTEPFPEEILVRLKLQFLHDEQMQMQQGRRGSQAAQQQQAQHYQQQLRHVMTLPIDKSASVGVFPHLQASHGHAYSPTGSAGPGGGPSLTQYSAPSTPAAGTPTGATAAPLPSSSIAAPPVIGSEKKGEDGGGYSSASIGDTVMRYLRMARKSSKADNKETIDKFKTVNYDRSLRYIKSKNVTVEEALAHEKNKAAAAAAAAAAANAKPQQQSKADDRKNNTTTAATTVPTHGKGSQGAAIATPSKKDSKTKEKKKVKPKKDEADMPKDIVSSSATVGPVAHEDTSGAESAHGTAPVLTQEDITRVSASTSVAGSDSNATSTPQTPLSPTSTSAPPSSMYPSSRSGSGSSSVPSMSPPPLTIAAGMVQASLMISSSGGQMHVLSPTPTQQASSPAALPGQQQQAPLAQMQALTLPPPPEVAAIGVQAGESLVHLLRNYNPARKFSIEAGTDFSSLFESSTNANARSSVATSTNFDSDIFFSHMATGPTTPTSTTPTYSSTVPDPSTGGGAPRYQHKLLVPASSGPGPPSPRNYPATVSNVGSTQWSHSGISATGGQLKKSASSHPMLLRIDDTAYSMPGGALATIRSTSPSNLSSTSSTGSMAGIVIGSGGIGASVSAGHSPSGGGSLSAGTTSFPSLISSSTSPRHFRQQHHSALGLYPSSPSSSMHHAPGAHSPSSSDLLGSSTNRKLTWATTTAGSLPAVSSSSSSLLLPSQSPSSLSSSRPFSTSTSSSPSNYSSLASSASHFLSSFRGSRRKESKGDVASALLAGKQAQASGSGGLLGTKAAAQSYYDDPLVMQKSKSSSSVFHHIGGSATRGGGSSSSFGHGTDTGTGEKRGSTSSVVLPTSASTTTISGGGASAGSRLMSRTRLFKSKSKSQSRIGSTGGGGVTCTWSPQGKCRWVNLQGRHVTLQPTTVLHLNEAEKASLQIVALSKLKAMNLDVEIKIPQEKPSGTLQKPKRRAYVLKKKALSTGFFESGSKEGQKQDLGPGGSGLVFGIPLSQCVTNDKKLQKEKGSAETTTISGASSAPGVVGSVTGVVSSWEQNIPPNATSTDTIRRSQNGSSRNSVSSVFETAVDKVQQQPRPVQGSDESLYWARKRGSGSNAALDSLSSSTGDLLADHIPSIDSVSPSNVPSFVTSCIKHLENYGLHTTGIFRVSTSLKRIRQLREEIDSGRVVEFGAEHSPHDVAALLKEFLRDMPEPLLSRDLYQAFLRTQKIRNRRLQLESVQHLVQLLPVANRDTLAALLKFFAKVVDNASDTRTKTGEILAGNKMEAYSLATLIAPNILPQMPAEGWLSSAAGSNVDPNSVVTLERRESIDVVNFLISNWRDLFEIPAELLNEVYVNMMESHPEMVDHVFKQKSGYTDDGDELETTSSVFEGSECGEDEAPPSAILAGTKVVLQRREDILHKDGGKGGSGFAGTRAADSRRQRGSASQHASRDSDLDKQQSGCESDSSSTKSASRWFRRHATKSRASSDSGSEVGGRSKGHDLQHSRRKDSLHYESKRANSLDSVTSTGQNVITLTEHVINDASLQVPDSLNRRQSSPTLDRAASGVITASLKIPVNIDDADIPFIEDDGAPDLVHVHHHQFQHPLVARGVTSTGVARGRSESNDSAVATALLGRHSPSFVPTPASSNATPASSQTGSPMSSPLRQPSSEVSTPLTFSPPMSPSSCDEGTATFPYEEMTARFCIGRGGVGTSGGDAGISVGGSEAAATTSSSSTSSSLHSGTTIVSKVPNTKISATAAKQGGAVSSEKLSPVDSTRLKPQSQQPIASIAKSASSIITASSSNLASTPAQPHAHSHVTGTPEAKLLGRETKGANIVGLIKSKTADFEKIAKESQAAAASTQPSKIAANMRLRSQANIQLKQQFLLRQQERQTQQLPTHTGKSAAAATSTGSTPAGESGRSLQRRRLPSSSAAVPAPVTSSTIGPSPYSSQQDTQPQKPGGASGGTQQQQNQPSRWKRSEIIASRQTGSSSPPSSATTPQQQQPFPSASHKH